MEKVLPGVRWIPVPVLGTDHLEFCLKITGRALRPPLLLLLLLLWRRLWLFSPRDSRLTADSRLAQQQLSMTQHPAARHASRG